MISARSTLAVGVLIVGVVAGAFYWHSERLAPWEVAGLGMPERLALLGQRDASIYCFGADPDRLREEADKLARAGELKRSWRLRLELADALLRRGSHAEAVEIGGELLVEVSAANLHPDRKRAFVRDVRGMLLGAYLRWAETDNCLAGHNSDSCLLPLQGGGIHADPAAAERARAVLRAQLVDDPDDLFARWLLNLVAMALGEYPSGVPESARIDPAVFSSEGSLPRFFDVGPGLGVGVPDLAGGCILEDFDRDGDVDIVASAMGRDDALRYFTNEGDGTFRERTEEAQLAGLVGGLNLNHADYDNDGYADVYVMRGAWKSLSGGLPNSLLRNEGDGSFADVTELAGVLTTSPTQTATWADFDRDGCLDLFVGTESREARRAPSQLFRNRGDGTFIDEIGASGIRLHAFVKGSAAGDYNEDGLPDLYVSARYEANRLYRNLSTTGRLRFEDVTEAAGLLEEFDGFACWFFDFDNDGDEDIFAAGFVGSFLDGEQVGLADIPAVRLGLPMGRDGFPRLYRNQGDGTFTNEAAALGLERVILVMGANFGDIDNDGWLDLYLGTGKPDFRALMANRMFRNDGGRRFLDVTTAGGFGHLQKGHAIAFGDVDNDGDQDVYTVLGGTYPSDGFPNALFENPGNGNHWLTLALEGVESNRSAIGARIHVIVRTTEGTRSIHRTVGTGGSFGSSTLAQEIGLGSALAIDSIDVRWPSGATQRFEGVSMDRRFIMGEGNAELEPVGSVPFRLAPAGVHQHDQH